MQWVQITSGALSYEKYISDLIYIPDLSRLLDDNELLRGVLGDLNVTLSDCLNVVFLYAETNLTSEIV